MSYKGFEKKLKFAAFSVLGLFMLGLILALFTKVQAPEAIGWGLCIGVPLLLGLYAGLFATMGSVGPKDPKNDQKRLSWKIFLKWFGGVAFALSVLTIGYFFLDALFKGTGVEKALDASLSGAFCVAMTLLIFALPMLVGIALSWWVGKALRKSILEKETHKFHKLLILLFSSLAIPSLLDSLESVFGSRANLSAETVQTTRQIPATIGVLWSRLQFYEDTGGEAPLLFALGFPKPLRTEGAVEGVGDITKCVYDKGYLVKKITQFDLTQKRAKLAFDVIEQVNIEDRAIRLIDGSFVMNIKGNHQTLLQLRTRYLPKMTPRWMWRPIEVRVARGLHNHVIDKVSQENSEMIRLAKIAE